MRVTAKKKQLPKPKPKPLYPIPELITQLLVTINMYEGSDEAHMDKLVEWLRDVHLDLKNVIGNHPDYQDNRGLAKLDKAYAAAGWDCNGLRWHVEDKDMGEYIFIVEFDNAERTKWHLA